MKSLGPRARSATSLQRWSLLLTALLLLLSAGSVSAQVEELTLRVNDMSALPGGQVAVIVRTYASRPISQGQLCLRALPARSGLPVVFSSIDDWVVYSSNGDVVGSASLAGTDEIVIDFSSASSTVNEEDGPMLVVYATLASTLAPGETLQVELDEAVTVVEDPNGNAIPTRLRAGELDILSPTDPLHLSTEGHDVDAGSVAQLAAVTEQILPWRNGYLEMSYPVQVADGLPTVAVDPRFGSAQIVTTHPAPGVVGIDFVSEDLSLNTLPGLVLQVHLPIRNDAPTGVHPITIDTASALIRDHTGTERTVALGNLEIESTGFLFVREALFADDFDSGDVGAWSPLQ